MGPVITIGITCYNEGEWLRECWESVLAQDDDRWEASLIMDGTDHKETIAVFDSLTHPRLRKTRMTQNSGNFPLINKGVRESRTPLYYILDADDKFPPYAVRRVIETFNQNPGVDFAFGDILYFGAREEIKQFKPFGIDDIIDEWYCLIGASPYRKTLWEKVGGYADELASGTGDLDFWIGAMEAGAKSVYIPEIIYHQRVRPGMSVSKKSLATFHRKLEIIVERHPLLFADSDRRARFLLKGYAFSARREYGSGNWLKARELALKAAALGIGVDHNVKKILFDTSLPTPLFKAKKILGRAWRGLKQTVQLP
jgi:glycosyltransferase involved in cell wall biosynthesis